LTATKFRTMWQIAFEINNTIKILDRMKGKSEQTQHYVCLERDQRLLNFSSVDNCAVYLGVTRQDVQLAIKQKTKIQGYRVSVVFHRH